MPSFLDQIVAWIGIRSPTFQPNRSAVVSPTMAPVRVLRNASYSSGSSTYSGYMARNCSGSTGIWAKKFFGSW